MGIGIITEELREAGERNAAAISTAILERPCGSRWVNVTTYHANHDIVIDLWTGDEDGNRNQAAVSIRHTNRFWIRGSAWSANQLATSIVYASGRFLTRHDALSVIGNV